jgi:HPt (histidine-containing phosphotransfer) domain-containing protein
MLAKNGVGNTDKPVLDLSALLQIFGGVGPDCIEMLEVFLSSTEPLLDEVKRALADGDLTAARHAAHSAKGACNFTGAYRLGAICAGVDEALRRGDETAARQRAEALPAAFDDVRAAIQHEIADHV